MLVVRMVRAQGRFDSEVLKELAGRSGIFGQDDIDLPEHVEGAQRDVFQITNGGRNEV